MPLINGKQIRDATIAEAKLASAFTNELIRRGGTVPFTANQSMGGKKLTNLDTPTDAGDAVRKDYVDNLITGLVWKQPVATLSLVGNITVADLNNIVVPEGDAYVMLDGGTLTQGTPDLVVAAGDLVEFNGTKWQIIVANSGGYVPATTRAVLSTTTPLITPYLDKSPSDTSDASSSSGQVADNGRIVVFSGSSNTGTDTGDAVNNAAVLAQDPAHIGFWDNNGYVFEGTVPDGSWVQFTGAGQITAGSGLSKVGNTLNVNAGDGIDLSSPTGDAVNVKASDLVGTGLEENLNNLRLSAQGNGIAGGGGSLLSVQAADTSIIVGAGGVKAAVPSASNKNMAASTTVNDNDEACATGIVGTPNGDGYVQVMINGVQASVGNGAKDKDCYFSADGGVTAKAIAAIAAGDKLYWVGSVAGYQLDLATDKIDFNYNYAA